jgi:hypothetical protein
MLDPEICILKSGAIDFPYFYRNLKSNISMVQAPSICTAIIRMSAMTFTVPR